MFNLFSLFQWIRGREAAERGAFGAPGAPGASDDGGRMRAAIEQWARLYEENEAGMGLPATIAAEFARLVTLEMRVNLSGSERAEFLSGQLRRFMGGIRAHVEYGCALGGVVFKPYACQDNIIVDAVQADCFIPTAFDTSGRLTGAVFVDQMERDGRRYTRLERHGYAAGRHTVSNQAFVSEAKTVRYALSEMAYKPIALGDAPEWASLEPEMVIEGVDRPLFAYFKVPFANPIDRRSPLGVSVYSRAVRQIGDADAQYARLLWEFEGGELAVDAEESFLLPSGLAGGAGQTAGDGSGASLPKNRRRLFRGVCANERDFYKVFSPALRDRPLLNGLNAILRMVEWQCGLVYGTLSDPRLAERTAQEVKASRQRSYASVLDIQTSLQYALDDLIYAMDAIATLYGMAPAGEYDAAYEWDDSIIVDPESWVEGMRRDTEMGLLKPEIYLAKKYGVTLGQATSMMPG